MKKGVAIFIFCCFYAYCQAQQKKIVFFTDKNNSPYNINQPEAYLSKRAIERRKKFNIPIDITDLPVNPAYLHTISQTEGVSIIGALKWSNACLVACADETDYERLLNLPFVQSTQKIAKHTKNNFAAGSSFRLSNAHSGTISYEASQQQIAIHNGEWLHQQGATGKSKIIAMPDAGFYQYNNNRFFDSLMLRKQIIATRDFISNNEEVADDHPHGSVCLSVIAGNQNGSYVGSCPDAQFLLLRTEDVNSEQIIEEYYWGMGAEYADSIGVDVISSSVGYTTFDDPTQNHTYPEMDGETTFITRMANTAARKGILVVNSAGNDGSSAWKYIGAPADGDSVLAVGAIDGQKQIASFSSFGPTFNNKVKPDLVSVGLNTAVISGDGQIANSNGTSYATPNLAGLATCLWELFPETNNRKLMEVLRSSGDRFTNPDSQYGYGIPDLKKSALLLLQENFKASFSSIDCGVKINWSCKDRIGMGYRIERKKNNENDFISMDTLYSPHEAWNAHQYEWIDSPGLQNTSYRIVLLLDSNYSFTSQPLNYIPSPACLATSTQNFLSPIPALKIYPNPAQRQVTLEGVFGAIPGNYSIQLLDATGRVLRHLQPTTNNYTTKHLLDLSGFSPGIYWLRLQPEKQAGIIGKLIIQ